MASTQVLPNPTGGASARKRDHLEAGKRRLEEFRRKKAEGKPTKVVPTSQLPTSSADGLANTVPVESVGNVSLSDRDSVSVVEPTTLVIDHQTSSGVSDSFKYAELGSSNRALSGGVDITKGSEHHVQNGVNDVKSDSRGSSGISGLANGYDNTWLEKGNESTSVVSDLVTTSLQNALNSIQTAPTVDGQIRQCDVFSAVEANSDGYKSAEKHSKPGTLYLGLSSANLAENPENGFRQHSVGISSKPTTHNNFDVNAGSMESSNHIDFNTRGRGISESINRHLNIEDADWGVPNNSSMEYSLPTKSTYSQNSFLGSNSGRSRPSFLDSINTRQVSSASRLQSVELVQANQVVLPNNESTNGDVHSVSSPKLPPVKLDPPESSGFLYNNHDAQGFLYNNNDAPSKQDNFASLEQHIEDLTQEKFSLKRALDTSKSLAESLAFDNSSLTDSFNQQGKVINQLKSDMLQLQEEIQTQLMAFTTLKAEYANAQLECNAADERAKILASEVISLEEKALRLRSNELKLEKQLENSSAEISSCRRKLSSLEKECTDFQSMIEALQEEKKLLQSKLRIAALNENVIGSIDGGHAKKDAFTITEDLETPSLRNSSEEAGSSLFTNLSKDTSNSSLRHNNGNFLSDATTTIPNDQMKMVYNINSLISELALEKEELLRALAAESSNTSKLKDLNKELSQKLESQTQRFELLAAQKMVNENVHVRLVDTRNTQDAAEYTDEGDEVVERAIGWIMKLFPGGPTKRRTSKLV